MGVYTDVMFNDTADPTTAGATLNSGVTATDGNYAVPLDGRLIKVGISLAGQAATSLMQTARVILSCTIWTPNTMRFAASGAGILTAPAVPIPLHEFVVDQPVQTQIPITGTWRVNVTAVTPAIEVLGTFMT